MSADVDRSRAPALPPAAPFRFPEFERFRLSNGLEVLLLERRDVPLVVASWIAPAGADGDPLAMPGLAAMTGSLLDEGTTKRSGPEIARGIERLGGSLSSSADWNAAYVDMSLLAKDFATGIDLLAEVALEPGFPEDQLERLRRQALAELLRRRDEAGILAEEAFAARLYAGTPYGSLLLGNESSVAAIDRDAVTRFFAARYRIASSSLVLVGDLPANAVAILERRLAGTEAVAAEPVPAPRPDPPEAPRVVIVDRPGAAQTELRIGHVGLPRRHPDRALLALANALLGGKFTSRINLNLRERHGYTYGASSRWVDRRGPGPFVVATAVANPVAGAAAREILGELRRLRDAPPERAEVDESRDYLVGVFPYGLQTLAGAAARLRELATFELPSDHYSRTLDEIARAGVEDVHAVAARHLHPERAVVIAVGPEAEIRPQFADLEA